MTHPTASPPVGASQSGRQLFPRQEGCYPTFQQVVGVVQILADPQEPQSGITDNRYGYAFVFELEEDEDQILLELALDARLAVACGDHIAADDLYRQTGLA